MYYFHRTSKIRYFDYISVSYKKSVRSLHVGLELLPMMLPKEKPPLTVVGDVSGHIAIIIDDIIDDVDQFVTAAELLHERGVYKVLLY